MHHLPGGSTQQEKNPVKVVGSVQATTACSARFLEAAVQALNQAISLGVVGGGGDVLGADSCKEGTPDGAAKLQASIRGDGCRHTKPGDPGSNEGASAVISCCRGQRYCFHPPGGAIYDSKQIFITTCRGKGPTKSMWTWLTQRGVGWECVAAACAHATLP